MELTRKQEEGLKIAVERYYAHERWTCIAGYAGSGKSTLIKFIISALDVDPEEEVCYVAFTGKAATVLQQKGCPNATTAHKLLYKAKMMANGTFKFFPKDNSELAQYKVIVVDEVSMLPKKLWDLMLTHGIYIIAAGDPGQLPPVDPNENNHVLDKPHIFLDEIMRQAQDSEIIRFSMWIREGKSLISYRPEGKQVRVYDKSQVIPEMYDWADQIICAKNATRTKINNLVRERKGFNPDVPQIGDKIIGLHNNWDFMSENRVWALTNGTVGTIEDFYTEDIRVPYYISEVPITYMFTQIVLSDGDKFCGTPIDYKQLITGEGTLTGSQCYQLRNNRQCLDPPLDFSYAYAITCWKAQGSEYGKVLGFEENHPFDREEHKKYLYTMATRASDKLVIIRK